LRAIKDDTKGPIWMFIGGPNSLSHGSGLYCKLSTLVKFLRKAGFVGKV